jgi:hypothetical protein
MLSKEQVARLLEAIQHIDKAFVILRDLYRAALDDADKEWRNKPLATAKTMILDTRRAFAKEATTAGCESIEAFMGICSAAEISVLTGLSESASKKILKEKDEDRERALDHVAKVVEKAKELPPDMPEDERIEKASKQVEKAEKKARKELREKERVARREERDKADEEARKAGKPLPPRPGRPPVLKFSNTAFPVRNAGESVEDYQDRFIREVVGFIEQHSADLRDASMICRLLRTLERAAAAKAIANN